MSMQALNQLVARSIIDPGIVQAFSAGSIGDVIAGCDFESDVADRLCTLEAKSWSEFAVLAYRVVKAAEVPAARIELPSPVDGLMSDQERGEEEQAA
jgi:hypothetical protein